MVLLYSGLSFAMAIVNLIYLAQSTEEWCTPTASLTSALEGDQTLVYPVLMENGIIRPLVTLDETSQTHQSNLQIAFTYMAKEYLVRLQLNREIRTKKYYSRDVSSANIDIKDFKSGDSCYYQGVFDIPEHADDFVTLSTCSGLRGTLRINAEPYSIQPVPTTDRTQLCQPHVVTKLHTGSVSSCSNTVSYWPALSKLHATEYYRQLSRAASSSDKVWNSDASWIERNLEQKHLKLGLVVDNSLSSLFSHNISNIRDYLLDSVNIVDLFYQRVNMRVSLVYDNIWRYRDEIDVTRREKTNLNNFLNYTKAWSSSRPYDIIHLLSGKRSESSSAGLAVPTSICTDRSVAVVSAREMAINAHKLASVIAHMIGHNIGLEHDTLDCECKSSSGSCIMGVPIGTELPCAFSSCSTERLALLTKVQLGQCLVSPSANDLYTQKCGNGIIERGEQCDCGPPMACRRSDPCCDPSTCLLKSRAVCRTGACCQNCQPKAAMTLCRAARNDCDAPELCDGLSGECPVDAHIQDGQPCESGSGFCYQGLCPTKAKQCQSLWGVDSTSSPEACYSLQNIDGSVLGHCGPSADGEYRSCPLDDVLCGLLQCDGGMSKPVVGAVDYRKTSTNEYSGGQSEITCKTVSSRLDSDASQLGMVSDGTKCGGSSLCQGHRCVHVDSLRTAGCPVSSDTNLTCSEHGRCTSDRRCYCNQGYTGRVCDAVIPTLSVITSPSSPHVTAEEVEDQRILGKGVLVAVIVTLIILVIVAAITLFIFRRKACFRHIKKPSNTAAITRPNLELSPIEASNSLSLQSPNYYGYRSRRRRRHRRRRHSSSSSSSSQSESVDEESLPCVIYDVPVTGDHIKGILKKPSQSQIEVMHSECNSQCSCSQSTCSSASIHSSDQQQQPIVDRIPVPQNIQPLPSVTSSAPTYNPDINVSDGRYSVEQHDSNSDSAIDIPKGDRGTSTMDESSSFTQMSPTNNVTKQSIAPDCLTYLQPLPDKSNFTQNFENLNDTSVDNTLSLEVSCESATSTSRLIPNNTSHHSPQLTSSVPSHADIPLLNETSLDDNFSTYSIRPVNGPMRTFQPVSSPINDRNGLKTSNVREPLISHDS